MATPPIGRHVASASDSRTSELPTRPAAVERGFRSLPERPYEPGWLDRLVDRIDGLPGANGLYALGLLVFQATWVTVALWWNGALPVGTFDLQHTFVVVIAPYLLWVRFYLDRVAGTAMDAFRPVLPVSDPEFQRLRYELTTLPPRTTWIVTVLAVVAYVVNALLLPDWMIEQFGPSRGVSAVVLAPVALLTMAVVAISTVQAIRQLWMVNVIHGLVEKISPFRAKALYAFSGLAARTGASFLLLAYYIAAIRPDVVRETPVLKLLVVAMVPTAVACFIVPLYGMHRRLAAEKDRLLVEAGARFERVLAELHRRVEEGTLADADKLNDQLSSVATEREALARISIWPWDASTMTGFITTLVLPVILWLVQRLLGRMGL